MNHLMVFVNFLSFTMGFAAIIVNLLIYLRYRQKVILYYLLFLVSFTLSVIVNAVYIYWSINVSYKMNFVILPMIGTLLNCLLLYTTPLFFFTLLKIPFTRLLKAFYLIPIALFLFFMCIVQYFTLDMSAERWGYFFDEFRLTSALALLNHLFFTLFTLIRSKDIEQPVLRKIVRIFMVVFLIFFPGQVIDVFSSRLYFLYSDWLSLPYGFSFIFIFYMVWNGMTLFFSGKHLFKKHEPNRQSQVSDQVLKKHQLSGREIDVVLLLLNGYSYQEISDKLFISIKTVKTHLHNVYQKTKTRNKIELSNLLHSSHL